ncbi:hypothetical protein ABBQ38_009475 [Trebouxia sp. C0009 RCD-2024]
MEVDRRPADWLRFADVAQDVGNFRRLTCLPLPMNEAFSKDSTSLRFSLTDPIAVPTNTAPNTIQFVIRNKDHFEAVAIVRKRSWDDQRVVTVCTRFPEDIEDNWTWDTFNFAWHSATGWIVVSENDDIKSCMSTDARDKMQTYFNRLTNALL